MQAYEQLHGFPTERADLGHALHAALHANLNRAPGAAAISPSAFLPLADGPIAPPPRPSAEAAAPDWGDRMFQALGQRVAPAERTT